MTPEMQQPIFTKDGVRTLLFVAAAIAVPCFIEAYAGDWLRLWVKPWLQPDAFFSLLTAAAILIPAAALACAVMYGLYRFAFGSVFGAIMVAAVLLHLMGLL